jgi:hypothetical protein
MEFLFSDTLKAILLGILAVGCALGWLARRQSHIGWLQMFRLPTLQLGEEQKRARRRMANRIAGLELATAGLALPLVYIAATVFMFNDFDTVPTVLVLLASLACIVAGIVVFWKNR